MSAMPTPNAVHVKGKTPMTAPLPTDLLGEIYAQWSVEMENYPTMSTSLLRIIFDDWQRATAEPEG